MTNGEAEGEKNNFEKQFVILFDSLEQIFSYLCT